MIRASRELLSTSFHGLIDATSNPGEESGCACA